MKNINYLIICVLVFVMIFVLFYAKSIEGMDCLSSHNGMVWYNPYTRRVCDKNDALKQLRNEQVNNGFSERNP